MANEESLLSLQTIYLFGREIHDLKVAGATAEDRGGANNFLRQQFKHREARLVRVYAFSYEGYMYELSRPSVFLLHGPGEDPDSPPPPNDDFHRLSRAPGRVSKTGVGRQYGEFSMDIKVWAYERGDFSMRLDVETGTLEHILLAAELDEDEWSGIGRSNSGRSGNGRSGNGRSGNGRSGNGRSGNGRSGN